MSWSQKLYETFNLVSNTTHTSTGKNILVPVAHKLQNAHIEIVIDLDGNFNTAKVILKIETIIPTTEKSATRTANDAPYPLSDKIQYIAKDYKTFGGRKDSYFDSYSKQLQAWASSPVANHPKVNAVFKYISKGTVVADLIGCNVLHTDSPATLACMWNPKSEKPAVFKNEIFSVLPTSMDQGDAFVRWRVEEPGNPNSTTWEDPSLFDAWTLYNSTLECVEKGLCFVTGNVGVLATKHPGRIRHSGDGAKLISSNDSTGYTFRGRFSVASQAVGMSSEASQKIHNALQWLIKRQSQRFGNLVFVSWATGGQDIPDPFADTSILFGESLDSDSKNESDFGQTFALKLNKKIAGYKAKLGELQDIVVIGLDSASDGRIAIVYYRELQSSEFLRRIENWHSDFSWHLLDPKAKGKTGILWQIFAPSPSSIAEACFSKRIDDKLKKHTIQRILPCILDSAPIPRDLVESVFRRACNRVGIKDPREWEQTLGIACALFKGYYERNSKEKRSYQMALEPDRTSRDYLYGRLLAIADHLEERALHVGGESRDTTAFKLMQRFADRPFSTWKNIETSLVPYQARLKAKRAPFLQVMKNLLTEVTCLFQLNEYQSDVRLNGEFLLGYHCQRQDLNRKKSDLQTENTKGEQ